MFLIWYDNTIILIIENYFTVKLREFYSTKGSRDQFCIQKLQSALFNCLLIWVFKTILMMPKSVSFSNFSFSLMQVINNNLRFAHICPPPQIISEYALSFFLLFFELGSLYKNSCNWYTEHKGFKPL